MTTTTTMPRGAFEGKPRCAVVLCRSLLGLPLHATADHLWTKVPLPVPPCFVRFTRFPHPPFKRPCSVFRPHVSSPVFSFDAVKPRQKCDAVWCKLMKAIHPYLPVEYLHYALKLAPTHWAFCRQPAYDVCILCALAAQLLVPARDEGVRWCIAHAQDT